MHTQGHVVTIHVPVVVVGGGISGLVCAHELRKAGVDVLLLESSARTGGAIQSERRDGFLLELGPQSFSGTRPLRALCDELGISTEIVEAPASAPRFVLVDGKLQSVPLSPPALLKSPLLGVRTKLSLARDAAGRTQPPEEDESVANFVRRKFTPELLDKLVGPFISGIYGGDPERLSLRSAFPQIYAAEISAGSVIRGLKQAAKNSGEAGKRPTLLNFRGGMEKLVLALREKLGNSVRVSTEVTEVTRASAGGRFEIKIRESGGEEGALSAGQLVVATACDVASRLLGGVNAGFSHLSCEYAPMAVIGLGFTRGAVSHPLNGFGFLVPRSAKVRMLGSVWNSSLFPGRAPDDHVLLTVFTGGATDREVVVTPEPTLIMEVLAELKAILGIREPLFSRVVMYRQALPQYNLGHRDRLAKATEAWLATPGLWLTGNYMRGPSIGACVEQAQVVAKEVLSHLAA
jgi:oxygen-dependent protoporphyrinogen oxidase